MLKEKLNLFPSCSTHSALWCGDWSQTGVGSVAGSATLQLCGLGHIAQPLRASVSSAENL